MFCQTDGRFSGSGLKEDQRVCFIYREERSAALTGPSKAGLLQWQILQQGRFSKLLQKPVIAAAGDNVIAGAVGIGLENNAGVVLIFA